MATINSSEHSLSSRSDAEDDEDASHPLDKYIADRHVATKRQPPLSPPPSPSSPHVDLAQSSEDAEGNNTNVDISTNSTRKEKKRKNKSTTDATDATTNTDPQNTKKKKKKKRKREEETRHLTTSGEDVTQDASLVIKKSVVIPQGITIIPPHTDGNASPTHRSTEMIRLLRQPRYFDEDYEENAKKCFKCGGTGHLARQCTGPPRLRSCYLCAAFGHDGRDCPAQLCWKCQHPGHQSRDCTSTATATQSGNGWGGRKEAVCMRCGREECPCAGYTTYAKVEKECRLPYRGNDLQRVQCFVCGKRGHLQCDVIDGTLLLDEEDVGGGVNGAKKLKQQQQQRVSCYTCGDGGHSGDWCWKDLSPALKAERRDIQRHDQTKKYTWARSDSSGGRGGGGGKQPRSLPHVQLPPLPQAQAQQQQQKKAQKKNESSRFDVLMTTASDQGGSGGGGSREKKRKKKKVSLG